MQSLELYLCHITRYKLVQALPEHLTKMSSTVSHSRKKIPTNEPNNTSKFNLKVAVRNWLYYLSPLERSGKVEIWFYFFMLKSANKTLDRFFFANGRFFKSDKLINFGLSTCIRTNHRIVFFRVCLTHH